MKLKNSLFIVVSSLVFVTSCSKSNSDLNPLLRLSKNIISTRSQSSSSQFIAVVKLKNPALMQSAQVRNGKAVIDPDLLAAVNKEQEDAIAALKALGNVQIIYRYKMVLNALAILAPAELEDQIKSIGVIASFENSGSFEPPQTFAVNTAEEQPAFLAHNSSKFIGAEALNERGITGKGIKVGVIDTGIDYTHKMFKGAGTEEAYKAVNPSEPNAGFPSEKVVGGIDLVGTDYNAASQDFQAHIPKPDMNPLDEAGHGSHVAGTIAGLGDGINTYNGMAPDASLYAIKVFGANGSTSDFVVIAALEYAADPNVDGNNDDQLDVVNLSLGSGYGNPHILYSEAIKNLVNGGTVVVASAGNSGHKDYIVGAPSTTNEALSVAASVDNGDHLWKFKASLLSLGSEQLYVEAVEAATTKKIQDGDVSGKLVYIGTANEDLSDEQKAELRGNVALIDRGVVTFNDKIKRAAEAGAIGVVVANNQDGEALAMGTTDDFAIPAIMIKLDDAKKVKAAMQNGDVTIKFKTDHVIEKPELIDTLTDFTSKGPRSVDGWIKPEISAPGSSVISAKMGGGAQAVQMSGTSMAAPHMSGVMALLKQAHPDLTALELKSVAMGTSKTIGEKGERYSVSLQGAGRVQADKAADSKIVIEQASLSLGEVGVETRKTIRKVLTIKNLSDQNQNLDLSFDGNGFISMQAPSSVDVPAKSSVDVTVNLTLNATSMTDDVIREMDGWVKLNQNGQEAYRVPVLAVAHRLSNVQADSLKVHSTSAADSSGAAADLKLVNKGVNAGVALLFNMIGQDDRKPQASDIQSDDCDLQSAGYRIVTHKGDDGNQEDFLQVAIKLYKPVTRWYACDVSMLIDSNGDGNAEQELLGANATSIPGVSVDVFASVLIDATKARDIRQKYESAMASSGGDPDKVKAAQQLLNFGPSLLDQQNYAIFDNSTVSVMEAPVSKLALTREGNLAFKLVVTHNEQSANQMDDYMKSGKEMKISVRKQDQSYVDLPAAITVDGNSEKAVQLTKGDGREKLLALFPTNMFSVSNLKTDSQSKAVKESYGQ